MRHGTAGATPEGRGDATRPGTPARPGDGPSGGRGWAYDEFTAGDELPAADVAAYLSGGLARTPGLSSAIRRRARLWLALAVIGLVLGIGLHKVKPPVHKATASVLVAYPAGNNPSDEVLTEMALVQSESVAKVAMRSLGLTESPSSFLASYTVNDTTDQVLAITANSRSSDVAVHEADAVASAYLKVRASELISQQQQLVRTLSQEVTAARQRVQAIRAEITAAAAQPPSAARKARLTTLEDQKQQAAATLTGLGQAAESAQVNGQTATSSVVNKTRLLNSAAAIPLSKLRSPVAYALLGLIAGLVIGLAIVVIQALVSDRLRRREDVAAVLGAPVGLSVGRVRAGHGLRAAEDPGMRQIVAHLETELPERGQRGALAVVPADPDSERVAGVAIVALALACARQGRRVMLADLSGGRSAERLLDLGDRGPGVTMVTLDGVQLAVAVTSKDDIMPRGPVGQGGRPRRGDEELANAYGSADLLLSLVSLDPSHGSDFLATWAAGSVAMITAGVPSATRIHAVGQLIRLSGTPVYSAVLIGADKSDDSLGMVPPDGADVAPPAVDPARPSGRADDADAPRAENRRGPSEGDLLVAADRSRPRR